MPRLKDGQLPKVQITLTLEPELIEYLQLIAKHNYEGNASMAGGTVIRYHKSKVNYKPVID